MNLGEHCEEISDDGSIVNDIESEIESDEP